MNFHCFHPCLAPLPRDTNMASCLVSCVSLPRVTLCLPLHSTQDLVTVCHGLMVVASMYYLTELMAVCIDILPYRAHGSLHLCIP